MKLKSDLSDMLRALALACAMLALLLFPQLASAAVVDALHVCGSMLLPSLFPFFVCSNLLIALELHRFPARALRRAMPRAFHAAPDGAAALVLGLLGGYPAGAQAAAQLYARGAVSRGEAERLVRFCNNAGPGFLFGVVGAGVFHSAACGAALYLIHILSAVVCGVLLRPAALPPDIPAAQDAQTRRISPAAAFTDSVRTAGQTALQVCMFVVVFGVLSRFLLALLPAQLPESLRVLLCGMLELGNGAALLREAALPFAVKFPMAAFLLGFGGISVWAQTVSLLTPHGLRAAGYLPARLLHGALSALLAMCAALVFPLEAAALPAMAAETVAFRPLISAFIPSAVSIFVIFRNLMTGNSRADGV